MRDHSDRCKQNGQKINLLSGTGANFETMLPYGADTAVLLGDFSEPKINY
jgi:hypothetical protein